MCDFEVQPLDYLWGLESSYVAVTWSHSPQKNTVWVVVLVKTCYFLWIHLPPQQGLFENPGLDWNLHLLPSKEGFAAAPLREYGICSELIFLLWGLPAHSLSHLHLLSLIFFFFIHTIIANVLMLVWIFFSNNLNQVRWILLRLPTEFNGYVVSILLTPLHSLSTLPDHINSWLGLSLLWINFLVPDKYFCIETNQYNSTTTFSWTGNILNSEVFLYQSFFYLHVSLSSCLQYLHFLKSASYRSGQKQLIYGGFWVFVLLSLSIRRITFPTFTHIG